MKSREKVIQNYVKGYNTFNINKMTADFSDIIVFENIQNGEVNMTLIGIDEFIEQAEKAKAYFSLRIQTITAFHHFDSKTEVDITYLAVLAMDFPNGMKKGDELSFKGKSVFEIFGSKIFKLTDIS